MLTGRGNKSITLGCIILWRPWHAIVPQLGGRILLSPHIFDTSVSSWPCPISLSGEIEYETSHKSGSSQLQAIDALALGYVDVRGWTQARRLPIRVTGVCTDTWDTIQANLKRLLCRPETL